MSDPDPGADDEEEQRWDDPASGPIEPGTPSLENVVFVVLGALGALYVIVRIAGLV